jgi:hypothetical protein
MDFRARASERPDFIQLMSRDSRLLSSGQEPHHYAWAGELSSEAESLTSHALHVT